MLGTLVVGDESDTSAGLGHRVAVVRRAGLGAGCALGRPPIVVVDPHGTVARAGDVVGARSLEHAAELVDPARTVVHLSTPSGSRLRPLTVLADLGFRRVLVDAPLARDEDDLREVLRLRDTAGVTALPVTPWLSSELTRRLLGVLRGGDMGAVRSVSVVRTGPGFDRVSAGRAGTSAFDVGLPHALTLVLLLAGTGSVTVAGSADMLLGDAVFAAHGGAWLRLRHGSGARSEARVDLTSPVRERRVTVELDGGTLVGHFPPARGDGHAHLLVRGRGGQVHSVFPDDAVAAFLARAYRHFSGENPLPDEQHTSAAVVTALTQARRLAGLRTPAAAHP